MAQDQLEEIKSKIDLVELISEHVPLKKAGRNFRAICPFHSEKTPSFIVSPERQIFKCFGCSEGGDHFGFLMKMEGLDFREALEVLAKRAGVKLKSYRPSDSERQKQLLYEINHLTGEFFHYVLLNHPAGKRARDYILGRGISQASIKLFKLGFAPDLWEGLQSYLVGKKKYQAVDLEKAGLIIPSTKYQGKRYYDRFRNRLMFPLKDHRGNVCGFAGRVLASEVKEAKYVNTPETPVYHKSYLLYGLTETKEAIKKADEVILVEGELDLISSFQAGVKNVVAIKGSALTETQTRLLKRFTQNLVLALDQDVAGDAAARRGIQVADAAGMTIKVVQLKGGKDPDEVAQKNPRLWQQLVKKAVPIYDYFLASALTRFDPQTAEGKRKIGQELIPILAKISSEIVRAHYVNQLSEKLNVDEEAIFKEMAKVEEKESPTYRRPTGGELVKDQSLSRREVLEEHLLALAFQSGNWAWLKKREVKALVKTPRFVSLLEVLTKYLKKYKSLKSERLVKMLPAELKEAFNRLYLLDFSYLSENEEKASQEFEKTLAHLRKLALKEDLSALSDRIGILEQKSKLTSKEKKELKSLDQKFRDLSLRLVEPQQKE